jgi:predicted GNAT family acetyltransferase
MVGMPEVDLGVYFSLAQSVSSMSEIRGSGYLSFLVRQLSSEIDAQAERAVLFLDKKYQSAVRR